MVWPSNPQYAAALTEFLRWVREDASYTPDGLVFLDMWGANRHAANVAFLAFWVSVCLRGEAQWDMTVALSDTRIMYLVTMKCNKTKRLRCK